MGTQQTQQQTSNSASDQKSLSFDDVSKLFSLPLSEAADTLGVCTSVLKKMCHENGLVRWPYRKFLSGKSIEQIKRDAARERNKELAELKAAGGRKDALATLPVSSSLGSQLQNKTSCSVQEMSKSRSITMQQQGNKNIQNGRSQNLHSLNLTKGTLASLDEFKYGFPLDGLSTASNKWWGSSSGNENFHGNGGEDVQEDEQQSKELVDDGARLLLDIENLESERDESDMGPQRMGSLTTVRKRAVEEGREALKLGVYRSYGANRLGRREKVLLLQIFKSSLPSQWRYGSF
uniref:RWP-RK domain-containing protein n=2 Tax=Davidia involucrata TaxID=16924 RepID=A0A5B7BEG7_DAVIN